MSFRARPGLAGLLLLLLGPWTMVGELPLEGWYESNFPGNHGVLRVPTNARAIDVLHPLSARKFQRTRFLI
jgi:hypothetical protein